MRGLVIFVLFLLVVGFFAIASEAEVTAGMGVGGVSPASVTNQNAPGLTFVPVVDRADDPVEMLPCTDQPDDCSLHSALAKANAAGKPVVITFADHYAIILSRPLPPITQPGVSVVASPGQEVRVNGNYLATAVFHIAAPQVRLEGLRIYGAGAGYPNVLINGPSQQVTIARNIIGDDDAPEGNCGQNDRAMAGIYIQSSSEAAGSALAWIVGNLIECHKGDGVVVQARQVEIGRNAQGQSGEAEKNVIRLNGGTAVNLGSFGGNTVCNTLMYGNAAGALDMSNYENNLMYNEIRQ